MILSGYVAQHTHGTDERSQQGIWILLWPRWNATLANVLLFQHQLEPDSAYHYNIMLEPFLSYVYSTHQMTKAKCWQSENVSVFWQTDLSENPSMSLLHENMLEM